MSQQQIPQVNQQLTPDQQKLAEEVMESIRAILEQNGMQLVPVLTLGPAGVIAASILPTFIPKPSRIIVPKMNEQKIAEDALNQKHGGIKNAT